MCTNNIQHDRCSYHCMRDSYKTSLVEFCAKPKSLFGEISFDHSHNGNTWLLLCYICFQFALFYCIVWLHVELRIVNISSFIFVFKGYCPEYDPIGQRIQKDIYTPCNPSDSSKILYSSSNLFFCKQDFWPLWYLSHYIEREKHIYCDCTDSVVMFQWASLFLLIP